MKESQDRLRKALNMSKSIVSSETKKDCKLTQTTCTHTDTTKIFKPKFDPTNARLFF